MEEREYIDLLTLQAGVAEAVADAFPEKLWVKAEIASISVKSNGHCYLELVESGLSKAMQQYLTLCIMHAS